MGQTATNPGGPQSPPNDAISSPAQAHPPRVWIVVLVALVAIIFAAVWLGIFNLLNGAIWSNSFVTSNKWTIPVGVLFFSLLVGLSQKYLRAPTVIKGGAMDSMKGDNDAEADYSVFPGALLSSYFSLLSGASVGPEGPLGILVGYITAWLAEKLKVAKESRLGVSVAAMASAYNGIIGSPLFTAMLATEFRVGGKELGVAFMAWNLLAGVIGYFFFTLLGIPVFAQYIPFAPVTTVTVEYVIYAILLGLVGSLIAIFVGLSFQVMGRVMSRFDNRVVLRAVAGGAVVAIVVYIFPELMFAGEKQIFPMIQNPAQYGVMLLLVFAVLKVLLLALSFKSGFLGGPTFPTLFASTMVAMALSLIFPGIPVSILVLCIEVGAVALLLSAPLTAILLVAVVGTADAYQIALMSLATVMSMFVGAAVRRMLTARAAQADRPDAERKVVEENVEPAHSTP